MKIQIAGCRGSLPSPSGRQIDNTLFESTNYGGNTTCFYLEAENGQKIIIDAGTGIRPLGLHLMKTGACKDRNIELYITHTHWDHIQGFPFFVPAYIKGNKIDIYGEAKIAGDLIKTIENTSDEVSRIMQINGIGMKEVLSQQQNPRNFPAPLEYMAGLGKFYDFIPGGLVKEENGLRIESMPINHPGGCVSYKFIEKSGNQTKTVVISTDFEPDEDGKDNNLIEWWKGADIVIADGQYEAGSTNNPFMKGWGHSDPFLNLDFARQAGVKHLIVTHHDPKSDDRYLNDLETMVKSMAHAREMGIQVSFAREGAEYKP